jgi:multicomponent Na+:H+ antiporter subunit E
MHLAVIRLPPHAVSVAVTCYATWVLLTWTMTAEVLIVGAVLALAVTAATLPLLADTGRMRVTPGRIGQVLMLAARTLPQILVANLALARRIWSPSLPIRTGMVTVPTKARSDAGLCAVGVVTSLIVDNQIVDLDRANHRLLYHAVVVPEGGDEAAYDAINGTVDRRIARIEDGKETARA